MPELDTGGFFDILFGHAPEPGWVTLATYPGGVYDPSPSVGPTKELWFQWPKQRADIIATASSNRSHDLYVCPILFKEQPGRKLNQDTGEEERTGGRRRNNAQWVGVVYADADQAQPRVFKLTPTVTVETSPGSHHLYWRIGEGAGDVVRLTRSGRAMAYAHKNDGCDLGGWDITQLLRVPKTMNNKPSLTQPHRVTATKTGMVYSIAEVEEAYPTSKTSIVVEDQNSDMPRRLPDYSLCYAKVSKNDKLLKLLNAQGRAPTKTQEGNRSELLWKLIMDLARAGLTKEEAFVLSWPVRYNKFRLAGRPRSFWWSQVVKGYETLKVEERAESEETAPEKVELKDKAITLLTSGERANLPTTWIDRYKGWASTKTDADLNFQEGAAWTVLSSIYGEFGKPATKFDSGNLNLWMMVLGGTTLSRKSTVRSMMLATLRQMSDNTYDYDMGSNATSEGLHNALLDRPGWTSLFHRDEVHGMNEEASKKSYLAGMQEFMTELYDGFVPGKLRAQESQNAKGCQTNFVMYLTGATDHVINSYQLEDFASGHLARFLYVYAEPRQMTYENLYIEQAEEPNHKAHLKYGEEEDPVYQHLLSELTKGRDFWSAKIKRGEQRRIFWEKDAWERFNQIQTRAMFWADAHSLSKALVPTTQRTIISLLKMATVLAMADREQKVQMRHLLRAAVFMENSLTHLVVVLQKMHTTKRAALLDEIITQVRLAGKEGMTKQQLYKPFASRYERNAFWSLVADLNDAGEVYVEGSRIKRKE